MIKLYPQQGHLKKKLTCFLYTSPQDLGKLYFVNQNLTRTDYRYNALTLVSHNEGTLKKSFRIFFLTCVGTYLPDILWGQPIKLAQVASTSELLENQQNDLVFFKIISSGPQKPQRLTASKIKFEKFGPKILIPR